MVLRHAPPGSIIGVATIVGCSGAANSLAGPDAWKRAIVSSCERIVMSDSLSTTIGVDGYPIWSVITS